MRACYPSFLTDRLRGGTTDLSAVSITALAVGEGYSYSDAHTSLSDIPAEQRLASTELASVSFVGGWLLAASPRLTFPASSPSVRSLVLYYDTGTLMYFSDEEHQLPWDPPVRGGSRVWAFPSNGLFRL